MEIGPQSSPKLIEIRTSLALSNEECRIVRLECVCVTALL